MWCFLLHQLIYVEINLNKEISWKLDWKNWLWSMNSLKSLAVGIWAGVIFHASDDLEPSDETLESRRW